MWKVSQHTQLKSQAGVMYPFYAHRHVLKQFKDRARAQHLTNVDVVLNDIC